MRMVRVVAVAAVLLGAVCLAAPPAHAYNGVWAVGHVQDAGWMDPSPVEIGTTGKSLRLESVSLIDPVADMRGHVQNLGWGAWSQLTVGTTGQALRLEAIQITGRWDRVMCQAHVQNIGWMDPVGDGEVCGTTGRSLRLEAVRIWFEQ